MFRISTILVLGVACLGVSSCTVQNPFSKNAPIADRANIKDSSILQSGASANRTKMTESLKALWADISSLTPDLLDAVKTPEPVFAAAYAKVRDTVDIPRRTALVEYFKSQNLDVSAFTPEVVADGAKFETLRASIEKEMVKKAPILVPSTGTGGMDGPFPWSK